jgi:hypothetical protein
MVITDDRDWEVELQSKYPTLLKNIYIECGEGWKEIIENTCDQILTHEAFLKNSGIPVVDFEDEVMRDDDYCSVRIVQIKQKFGGLRIYYDGGDKIIQDIVREAETKALTTCEYCGSKENVKLRRHNSWLYTGCDKHDSTKY